MYKTIFGNVVYTEGVKDLAETNGAYWLIDLIASYQHELGAPEHDFQLWELSVSGGSGKVTCRKDTDELPDVEQEVVLTEYPKAYTKLYVEHGAVDDSGKIYNVLMLPEER